MCFIGRLVAIAYTQEDAIPGYVADDSAEIIGDILAEYVELCFSEEEELLYDQPQPFVVKERFANSVMSKSFFFRINAIYTTEFVDLHPNWGVFLMTDYVIVEIPADKFMEAFADYQIVVGELEAKGLSYSALTSMQKMTHLLGNKTDEQIVHDDLFEGMSLPKEAFVPNGAEIERQNHERQFRKIDPEWLAKQPIQGPLVDQPQPFPIHERDVNSVMRHMFAFWINAIYVPEWVELHPNWGVMVREDRVLVEIPGDKFMEAFAEYQIAVRELERAGVSYSTLFKEEVITEDDLLPLDILDEQIVRDEPEVIGVPPIMLESWWADFAAGKPPKATGGKVVQKWANPDAKPFKFEDLPWYQDMIRRRK